ncbi:hypothetical protein Lfu02_17730 [Longispora fulva]|uniref:TP901 family phage tail tape measure protein n=1 Tax=Longispora fulva TaxID=619741 RepID=A0A8J7KZ53_9ACTN|nr:phage tail tape measure protein [Longispora fulva]MBG6140222.1 TP901 family phage tail tape measure protein [Longispora fulva]GIG57401.1 hypothetical protein Lfu02_17730 [Longispora fulva]
MSALPPVFVELRGNIAHFSMKMGEAKTEIKGLETEGSANLAKLGTVAKYALAGIAVAAAGAAVKTLEMGADFQSAMTRVHTGAGESEANMKLVSDGVLKMAGDVGTSTEQLTKGLYTVESASFHGADALTVLRASAMGAKVGAAELGTVTDAVTTALNAYGKGAAESAQVTNALIATESAGKTTMEALAGSLATVLPTAATAKVGLNEVLGAMATMTAQGTPAADAATYLRQTIAQLSNPSGKAAQEMKSLGLNAIDVSMNLGKNGLASTLTMLTDAIQSKMGPAGTVLVDHLRKAASSSTDFEKVLAGLPPAQQTYIGALATMVGGTKSMQAALELTGDHMKTFRDNTASINERVKDGGNKIADWDVVQKNWNQRVAEAKGHIEALGIKIGTALMPAANKLMDWLSKATQWLTQHKSAMIAVAAVIGGVLVIGLAAATVAAWNFAVALLANPLVWIVVGVMALIAAIVLLIMHWKDVWGWIKNVSSAIADWVVKAWHSIADWTTKLWRDHIVKPIVDAWHSVTAFFSAAYHFVVDPILKGWHVLTEGTRKVFDGIVGFFKKWWPLLLLIFMTPVAILLSIWNHFHTQIEETARKVFGAVVGFFTWVWSEIQSGASAAWQLIQHYIVDPILWVHHKLEEIALKIHNMLVGAWQKVHTTTSDFWDKKIKPAVVDPIMNAWHSLVDLFEKVKSTVSGKLQEAWNLVSNIGSKFATIGENIVRGIISGLSNGASWLWDKIRELANGALDHAKKFLGISSPSRVFAQLVGAPIAQGVAAGIDDHAHLAATAAASMAAATLGASSLGSGTAYAVPGGGSSYSAGASAQSAAPVVNVTVQGSVLSERDLRDLVARELSRWFIRNGRDMTIAPAR